MLQIITDSASDITAQQAKNLNIHIAPIGIQFPDGPCPQESHEDFLRFYNRLEQAQELPMTSQPPLEYYISRFEEAKKAGDPVLVITLSSGLSGTVNGVHIAKEMADYDQVYIVDSRQAIASQRILTEHAVKLRDQGVSPEQIVAELEALRDRATVYGVIDTLTFLRKGGRIPASLAILGNTLRIKPVIVLEDAHLKAMGKALGTAAGKRMVHQRIQEHMPDPAFPIYFVYTSDREMGEQFMAETIEKFSLQEYNTQLVPIGGVIGTHVGTKGVGLAYIMK